jgi:ABC-type multidrug transport system fused ATPase/permease subunit
MVNWKDCLFGVMKMNKAKIPADKKYNTLPVIGYFLSLAFKHSKMYCFISVFDIIIRSIAPFINIIFPKLILDEIFCGKDIKTLVIYIAIITGGNAFIRFVQSCINTMKARKADKIGQVFDRLIGMKYMSIDFQYTEDPEALTQAEKAATGMSWHSGGVDGLVNRMVAIISSIIKLIGVTYIFAVYSPFMILIIVAIIAVNTYFNAKLVGIDAKFRKDLVEIERKLLYYFGLNINFQYGKDIRIYGADSLVTQRTKIYNKSQWQCSTEMNKKSRFYNTLMQITALAQIAITHLYLASRIITGYIVFSDYVMLVTVTGEFTNSINTIIANIVDTRTAASFMSEYKRFMDYPDYSSKGGGMIPAKGGDHVIQFKNVSFRYPNREELILNNINITITPNEKLSIVGLNGAGKTTFIKLLCRLYDPTEGSITLNNIDIRKYDYEEYMKLFGVVFQDYSILSFTVRDNIALERSDEVKGREDEQKLVERVQDSLKRAGIDEKVKSLERGIDTAVYKNFDRDGMEFSGGETQKLAIARAIYKDAPIVVLDEPTAALDPIAEYEIYSRFDNLIGDKTTIYISHRLSSCRFCDVIAVFHEGKIAEYGNHNELVKLGGHYTEMWDAQAQYYV